MNDDRNDTEYSCGTVSNTVSQPTPADIEDESVSTILYVAGEYQMIWKIFSYARFRYTIYVVRTIGSGSNNIGKSALPYGTKTLYSS